MRLAGDETKDQYLTKDQHFTCMLDPLKGLPAESSVLKQE